MTNAISERKLNKNKNIDVIATVVVAVTLFALFFIYGVQRGNDTHCYETFRVEVMDEPVYSLFLAFFRVIFGSEIYLYFAVFVQTLLAVFSVYFFVKSIANEYLVHYLIRIIMYIIMLAFYTMPVIFSRTGVLTFLSILTEALAYPLFMIFIVFMMWAINNDSIKWWWISLVTSFVLSLTRTQLLFTLIMVAIAGIYIGRKTWVKSTLKVIVSIAITVLIMKAVQSVFCYSILGMFEVPPNSISMYGNAMLIADEDDNELFEDELVKSVFEARYEDMTNNGWGWEFYQGNSVFDAASFYEECYDNIKDHMSMGSYFDDNNITYGIDKYNIQNATAKAMTVKLIPKHFDRWIYNYVGLCLVGFIRTVAVSPFNTIMQIYSLLIYVILIIGIIKNRKDKKILLFGILTIVGVLGQVCETSITVMCISRYMMYMFPMVYFGIIIMWSSLIKFYKEK